MTSVTSVGLALSMTNDSSVTVNQASLFNDKMTTISSALVPQSPSPTPNVPPTKNDWDSLFCPMFDEYFNPSPSVVQPVLVAGIQEPVVSTGTPSSTVEEDDHGIEVAHMDNDLQIKEQKENGVVELYFVGTEFQLADIFSKPLGQEKLEFLMKNVGMQSMSPETLKKLADETEELWWIVLSVLELDNMANEHVPVPATLRSDDQILLFNAWVPIGKALTASADVPSSFTATTETTSTLPPPPPPLQQSTVHRDIW
ncbi:hypothetical protein Tco_0446264 [Tanacetum coccineum]